VLTPRHDTAVSYTSLLETPAEAAS